MNENDKISIFIKLHFPAAVKCWRDTADRNEEGEIEYNEDGTQKGSIPVLFILAQKGLESGWGDHSPQFNSSGLTPGPSWKGRTQLLPTTEDFPDKDRSKHKFPEVINIVPYKAKDGTIRYTWHVKRLFRAYDSASEAWVDYGKFLKEQERYAPAFEFTDPKKFATAIAAAGYATSRAYTESLHDCIDSVYSRLPLLGLRVPE